MVHELQLRLLPRDAYNEQSICEYLRHERGLQPTSIRVLRRSIDARQRTVLVNLTLRVFENEMPHDDLYTPIRYGDVSEGEPVLVVGAGPGGLFAALRLIELGMKRIVLEGSIPSPANPPAGCKFHTRCSECMEKCKYVAPEYREVKEGHFTACHLYNTPEIDAKVEAAMKDAKREEEKA